MRISRTTIPLTITTLTITLRHTILTASHTILAAVAWAAMLQGMESWGLSIGEYSLALQGKGVAQSEGVIRARLCEEAADGTPVRREGAARIRATKG